MAAITAPADRNCLVHDGWETATAFHYLRRKAREATFVMVMPDVRVNGEVAVYVAPYEEHLAPLLDRRSSMRARGFSAFAHGAHLYARAVGQKGPGPNAS